MFDLLKNTIGEYRAIINLLIQANKGLSQALFYNDKIINLLFFGIIASLLILLFAVKLPDIIENFENRKNKKSNGENKQ